MDAGLTILKAGCHQGLIFLGLDHDAMLSLLKDPNLLIFSGHGHWSVYSSQQAVVWAIVFGVWGTDMTLGPSKEPKLLSSRLKKKKKKLRHGRRSDYSQQWAAIRAIVFFLGLGHRRDARPVDGD